MSAAVLGDPGLVPQLWHGVFPVCLVSSPLIKTQVMFYRVHSNPVWLHLNLIISTETLFLNKVTTTGTGAQNFYIFLGGGHNSSLITPYLSKTGLYIPLLCVSMEALILISHSRCHAVLSFSIKLFLITGLSHPQRQDLYLTALQNI
jgi:hypothetical protein